MDKPDVAVWNKTVQKQDIEGAGRRLKIGPLNQNLIREDKNDVIDSANEKDVADVIISGTKVTRLVYLTFTFDSPVRFRGCDFLCEYFLRGSISFSRRFLLILYTPLLMFASNVDFDIFLCYMSAAYLRPYN